MQTMHISEVQTDDVVSFVYDGGSNPNTCRRICVTCVGNKMDIGRIITGFDIDKQAFRAFNVSLICKIIKIGQEPVSNFTTLLDAKSIQRDMKKEDDIFVDIDVIQQVITRYSEILTKE